jgi:sugar phosphate isomerase/epimerase
MFKTSILFGDGPNMDPAKIAPGFEMAEIPAEVLVEPFKPNALWEKRKQELKSYSLPPIKIASHWMGVPCTGPDVDWDLLEFWTRRVLKRLAEIKVEYAGVYGLWFPKVKGYSEIRQMDQAIRYANYMGDCARENNMGIIIEPMADLDTLWPTYKEGLQFMKRIDHPNVKIMADLNYFLKLNQPFEDIKGAPEYCMHCHIAGKSAQPNVGGMEEIHKAFFRVLRDIDYQRGVSCACPWVSTEPGEFDLKKETAKALAYIVRLREQVYNEKH